MCGPSQVCLSAHSSPDFSNGSLAIDSVRIICFHILRWAVRVTRYCHSCTEIDVRRKNKFSMSLSIQQTQSNCSAACFLWWFPVLELLLGLLLVPSRFPADRALCWRATGHFSVNRVLMELSWAMEAHWLRLLVSLKACFYWKFPSVTRC